MTKKKSNINWYFLLAGVLVLYFSLSNNRPIKQTETRKITAELSKDITSVKGRKSSIDYTLWTKEYKNRFIILDGSITRGKHQGISNLKSGEIVDLLISATDYNNLTNEKEDIIIRGISLKGNDLMSQEEFHNNQFLYNLRLTIISVFIGLMLLLNGLITIPQKVNYVIIGIFAGGIILLRILEIGLY